MGEGAFVSDTWEQAETGAVAVHTILFFPANLGISPGGQRCPSCVVEPSRGPFHLGVGRRSMNAGVRLGFKPQLCPLWWHELG